MRVLLRSRPPVPHRRPAATSPARTLLATLLVTTVVAFAANFALDLWQLGGDLGALWELSLRPRLSVFLLSTLLVWLVVLLVLAVTGRLWLTVGVVAFLTLLAGFANHRKLQLRLEPLYPSDLAMALQPEFLAEMIGPRATAALAAGAALLVGGSVLVGRLVASRFPPVRRHTHPRLAATLLGGRILVAGLGVVVLAQVAHFNVPGNNIRDAYEAQGAHWRPWNQTANYAANGFVGGLLYNTEVTGMVRPPTYSRSTMQVLADRYAAVADRINRDRDPAALDDVNVVMVLSETLSDPTRLSPVEFAEDPIPFLRGLMERTTSGNMLATQFGGGTANVEFSALTSLSMGLFQPQMTTPYQMLVPEHTAFPSLAGYLEQLGHRTVAIHPFESTLYRRREVYPVLGFDESVFADDMTHRTRAGSGAFVSDASAFAEVSDHLARSDEPLFVNLVTMQNHMPMAGAYPDPISVTGAGHPGAVEQARHYARGLRHTDLALQTFLGNVRRSGEKTVVLVYGDHLPGFWPPKVRNANEERLLHETPFLVWANFGGQQARRLPTTSPIHFGRLILDRAGAPIPPFYALLSELHEVLPGFDRSLMIGADDEPVERRELSPRALELLADYRLVQYDLARGGRHSLAEMFYTEGTSVAALGRAPSHVLPTE